MIRLGGEIFPFAPAVEVDEGLHAAPFHYFAGEPFEVDGLEKEKGIILAIQGFLLWEMFSYLCQKVIAARGQSFVPITL